MISFASFAEILIFEMAAVEDDFDAKKALPVEAMTKSEFQRWLMDQDSQVKLLLFVLFLS